MLMDLSNGHLLIKEEKILRKLVNLIHATTTNDFNLCTTHSRQLQYLLYTTYNTTTTTTHYNDIPSAAGAGTGASKQLEVYLFHLLQLNQPIEFYNMKLFNNFITMNDDYNDQKSNLIGIGYCFNGILMAYVNNYTTTTTTNSSISSSTSDSSDRNSICSQFVLNVQLFDNNNNNETIRFNDYEYGEFSSIWAPIQCESNSIKPIVLRYFIYTKEKSNTNGLFIGETNQHIDNSS
ncbi:unnamed protein product [Schistosoma mattheei]|uniref:Uncharacterized protein n=1 Tax=Schistosoma mattheei TaxID=31246 RepID=A0AA85BFE5_9TREM|nr:unnamed protein product [Schistosoma mattheei]